MRKALGTLPWVEHATVETDVDKREVRFNLKDKGAFNQDEVKEALKAQGFAKAEVKSCAAMTVFVSPFSPVSEKRADVAPARIVAPLPAWRPPVSSKRG